MTSTRIRVIPNPTILGIESSCDETAAAVVEGGSRVLSSVVATQDDLHQRYAGVVPEIASRAHLERIVPVIREAMRAADLAYDDLDAIAVGHRPGLIGSLLVGTSAAKSLAWSRDLPLIGVDHLAAHLSACELDDDPIELPALGLVVSGGHTSLFYMGSPLDLTLIGRTIDDAIGEAFDKAATILGLGYPGGPAIDRLARTGDDHRHDFPVAALGRDRLDFSFSGLKTALLYAVRGTPQGRGRGATFPRDAGNLSDTEKADFAASFERAAVKALVVKIERGFDRHEVQTLVIGGGVSANTRLRRELSELAQRRGLTIRLPAPEYCVDNAAMIAGCAAGRFRAGEFDDLSLAAATSSAIR